MNFLSVINNLGNSPLADVLKYNKETKELTFIDPNDGATHKCYVNSMQALVNFTREYVAPGMLNGGNSVNNVVAGVGVFVLISGEYADVVGNILKLAINENGPDVENTSCTYWLKAAIDSVQVLDALAVVNGTWSSVYSLSGLTEGKTYGPKVKVSFAGTINWGDGTFSEVEAGSETEHQYTKDGNYTITIKGPALAQVNYTGDGGTQSEGITKSKTPFEFKKTPTA